MSPGEKTNYMKSTLKIAFQSNMHPELPVIKIVQPIDYNSGIFQPNEDHDVRDEMLNAFLNKPASSDYYPMFTVSTSFPHPFENPTHRITTIAPVKEESVMHKIRHMVLNRHVPYDSIVTLNSMTEERRKEYFDPKSAIIEKDGGRSYFYKKIHDFFDWLEKEGYAEQNQSGMY